MTKSTNTNARSLSILEATNSLMDNTINAAYPSQEKKLRRFAWKVAPTLFISFKYAWAGVRYAFITQRNFRIHTIIGTLAVSLGFIYGLQPWKWR